MSEANLAPAVAALFYKRKFTLIAGPCVVESYDMCARIAEHLQTRALKYDLSLIFKASLDKANRSSLTSFRSLGLPESLAILAQIKERFNLPVLTDIHEPAQAELVKEVVDVLQIPAFLCRQTDLILAAAATGLPTNIKKGQFLAAMDMRQVQQKYLEGGGKLLAFTERGNFFGYHDLVVDMRNLVRLRAAGGERVPVIFDATHSVQKPGGSRDSAGRITSGGERSLAPLLARAALAIGIDGLFCEVHPEPAKALSDGENSLDYPLLEELLQAVQLLVPVASQLRQGEGG